MIKIENLTIAHKNEVVLKNVSLDIFEKENIFIIGKSGVGKTLFINSFFAKNMIQEGSIFINNENILEMKKKKFKNIINNISYISQDSYLIEDQSIFTNIYRELKTKNWLGKMLGISNKKDTNKILNILKEFGIFDKAFSLVSSLSGGEKQKVNLVISFLNKYQIFLADEPTTSLDIENSKRVINYILEKNKTSVVIVHNLKVIPPNTRVIAFKDKGIIYDGPFKLIKKEMLNEIYKQ